MGAREGKGISFLALFYLVVKMNAYFGKNYRSRQSGGDYMYQGYKEKVPPRKQEILLQTLLRGFLPLFCHYVAGKVNGIGRTDEEIL